jgi:hypothetical protein
VTRRIPYFFLVDKPALAGAKVIKLKLRQSGDTRTGPNLVTQYRYPVAPFGNAPDEPPMNEDGSEKVYVTSVDKPAANAGVSVVQESGSVRIDPFYLGALDENTVQGYAGTPVGVNALTYDYLLPIGAAGSSFPRQQTFYVAVDSGHDRFNGRRLAGKYILRSWVNDVTPPTVKLLSTQVSAGRPTIIVRSLDSQSGVDPLQLTIGYKGALVGASAYDPATGIAAFKLPASAPALTTGKIALRLQSSDFEEAKNVDTVGTNIMPNTRYASTTLRVVAGVAVSWVMPDASTCLAKGRRLAVAASAAGAIKRVRFALDGRAIGAGTSANGLWSTTLKSKPAKGRHILTATAFNAGGASGSARLAISSCR